MRARSAHELSQVKIAARATQRRVEPDGRATVFGRHAPEAWTARVERPAESCRYRPGAGAWRLAVLRARRHRPRRSPASFGELRRPHLGPSVPRTRRCAPCDPLCARGLVDLRRPTSRMQAHNDLLALLDSLHVARASLVERR